MLLTYLYGLVGAGVAQCSDCVTAWTIWGSNPGKRGFLFSEEAKPVLGPTQTRVQWVRGLFSRLNVSLHLISTLRHVELYLDSTNMPLRLRLCLMMLLTAGPSGCAVLKRRSAAARLMRLWVRILPEAWMS